MKNLVLLVLSFALLHTVTAQEKKTWTLLNESAINKNVFANRYKPQAYKLFKLEENAFRSDIPQRSGSFTISIPNADGIIERYKSDESSVMDPQLAVRYPEIRSYRGQGIDDPSSTIYFDITPAGFHGMILSSTRKTIYIDPVDRNEHYYVIFSRKDAINYQKTFHCLTADVAANDAPDITLGSTLRGADDEKLRTYRLALACTGEYAQYFLNGTETTDAQRKSKVLAAMATLMTRTNGIYERDFGIHMNLIANNDAIIYLNASTDPWTTEWNTKTQQTIDAVIGSANYDIGHLVHKESSAANNNGNAGCIACVCKAGQKGSGFTSHVTPEGDPFVVDYTTHEMGHQFGANHTFTFSNESGTASQFEPGSGSTIMGYAGITGSTDVQPHSDDYFHTRSIEQVTVYIKGTTGGGCAVVTTTGNATPTASAGASYTIPKSTPFALTGTATDANAGDVLSYTWEQINAGTSSTTMPSTTATSGPVFRSRYNGTNPTRTFPILSSILDGTNGNTWEKLPAVARTLTFRFTVRDNHPGGGNNQTSDASVTISTASGPFAVSSPNTAVSWAGGSTQNITWAVASTTATPVSCANVKISLSTDGGLTFPTILAASTANDGSESLTIPNTATTTARIKVEAVGNIFFDISNTNFTITAGSSCSAPAGLTASNITNTGATVNWNAVSGASSYDVDYKSNGSSTWTNAATATLSTSANIGGLTQGTVYDWRVRTNCASGSSAYTTAQFTTTSPQVCNAPAGLTSSAITNTSATVSWAAVSGSISYDLDYKLTSTSTWTNAATGTTTTAANLSGLNPGTVYDWRVRTNCASGSSAYTNAQFTTTAPVVCNAPSGLSSSGITSSAANVAWTAVSGASNYDVDYKPASSGTWTNAATATTALTVSISGLAASTVYDWRVRTNCSGGSSAYSSAQFTTAATQANCVTAYEANETLATAASIVTGTPISAAIGTSTDIDYYKITTTVTSNLNITLTNLPGDYDLYVYSSAGTLLGSSTAGSTTNETVALANRAAGTYYIKVIGYNGVFSTTVCYNLNATSTIATSCQSSYDVSTNGTISGAAVIPFNTNITGLISPSGDVDIYKFVISNAGTITVTLGTLPGDYDIKLLNSAGTQVAISQNGSTTSETINYTAAAGTYYAQVYGYNNANNATVCYTLKAQLGTASKEVLPAENILVKLYPNPATDVLNISLLGMVRKQSVLQVVDTKGTVVLEQQIVNNPQAVPVAKLAKGVYLVRVNNGGTAITSKFVKQ